MSKVVFVRLGCQPWDTVICSTSDRVVGLGVVDLEFEATIRAAVLAEFKVVGDVISIHYAIGLAKAYYEYFMPKRFEFSLDHFQSKWYTLVRGVGRTDIRRVSGSVWEVRRISGSGKMKSKQFAWHEFETAVLERSEWLLEYFIVTNLDLWDQAKRWARGMVRRDFQLIESWDVPLVEE